MNSIKEYCGKNPWCKYLIYISVCIIVVLLLLFIYHSLVPTAISTKEDKGIVIDTHNIYTTGRNHVAKCKKLGEKSIVAKLKVKNLHGAKLINGDLVSINSDKDATQLVWVDPNSLEFLDTMDLPFDARISFIDFYNDEWWVCNDIIYAFDMDWNLVGTWNLPVKADKILDGGWYDDYLYLSTKNKLYILSTPFDEEDAQIMKTVTIPEHYAFSIHDGKLWLTHDNKISTMKIKM